MDWACCRVDGLYDLPVGIHVVPLERRQHILAECCECGPKAEWADPDTGEPHDAPIWLHRPAN